MTIELDHRTTVARATVPGDVITQGHGCPAPRIAIVGASWIAGLGYAGRPFGLLAADELGAVEVLDLSESGRTLRETLDARGQELREFAPDLAFVDVGDAEFLVHAHPRVQRFIERRAPAAWHGVAGLEPRARFSQDRRRRRRQQVEAVLKQWVKWLTLVLVGGGPRCSIEGFRADLVELFDLLDAGNAATVVHEVYPVDDRLFPKTNAWFAAASREIVAESGRRRSVRCLRTWELALDWNRDFLADRAHLNASGHTRMAASYVRAGRALAAVD